MPVFVIIRGLAAKIDGYYLIYEVQNPAYCPLADLLLGMNLSVCVSSNEMVSLGW